MNDVDFRDMLSNMTAYHEGAVHLPEADRCANAIIQLLETLQQLQRLEDSSSFTAFIYLDIKESLISNWIRIFGKSSKHSRTVRNLKTFDYRFLGYDTQEEYWRARRANRKHEVISK